MILFLVSFGVCMTITGLVIFLSAHHFDVFDKGAENVGNLALSLCCGWIICPLVIIERIFTIKIGGKK